VRHHEEAVLPVKLDLFSGEARRAQAARLQILHVRRQQPAEALHVLRRVRQRGVEPVEAVDEEEVEASEQHRAKDGVAHDIGLVGDERRHQRRQEGEHSAREAEHHVHRLILQHWCRKWVAENGSRRNSGRRSL